jgi:hypothetical protein
VLLVVAQQRVPEGLPGEDLGVAEDDHAVASAREGHVEPAGVVQEADALREKVGGGYIFGNVRLKFGNEKLARQKRFERRCKPAGIVDEANALQG